MNFIKKRLEYLIKHNLIFQTIYKVSFSLIFRLIGFFVKTNNDLVLICSLSGRRYNDSPKVIFEYLIANKKYSHLQIIWAFENPEDFDIPAQKIRIDSLQYFIIALKAKYWITNINIERGLHFKKKTTRLLNTWHGTPLKLVGNAVKGRSDFNFSNVNVFCYASEYEKEIFIRDFRVREESLIYSGQPRNDKLYYVSEEHKLFLRKKLNIPPDKKVILYTPTWRDSINKGDSYIIKPPIDINYWKKKLYNKYIIIFRAHHLTTQLIGVEFDDFVRDVSNYPEINDLFIISDINISDYSGTLIDFSILERPMISFAYDYEEYIENRGLYIDLKKELPIDVVNTQEEVIKKIIDMDYEKECAKSILLKQKFLKVGGNATKMCVNALFDDQYK